MKQFDVKSEKTISGNKYYIRPLPAFKCANLSGELASLAMPIIPAVAPLLGNGVSKTQDINLLDIDAETVAPVIANGLSGISGDKIESLLKKLLSTYGNVSVELEGSREVQVLTDDLANEVFCGDVQDMFILAIEVIKVNYAGFFRKLGSQFGGVFDALLKRATPS